jgi:hypothetical protein
MTTNMIVTIISIITLICIRENRKYEERYCTTWLSRHRYDYLKSDGR